MGWYDDGVIEVLKFPIFDKQVDVCRKQCKIIQPELTVNRYSYGFLI